jgi:hypothetical protein
MAGLTTTQTFSDGDTVTAAKLNNIIANASIDADAITTAKINDDAVTLAQMADDSVDTGQLVDDAVQNSKLENMAASTVKANATSGSANPTDVAVAANKLLVGTSNSINAVGFTTDLEMDASDSAATLIRAAASLVGGKSSVTAAATDEILIKDATDGALKKVTAKTVVQSFDATTSESGAVSLATAAEIIDPTTIVAAADAVGAAVGAPMMAKAWAEFTGRTDNAACTVAYSNNITSITRTDTGDYSVVFTTALPSDKYTVMATGWNASPTNDFSFGRITARVATGVSCTVTYGQVEAVTTPQDPTGIATIIFFGSTS